MAHFEGTMRGCHQDHHGVTPVACQRDGTKTSGMHAELRGEFIGGRVSITHNDRTHRDTIRFCLISGTNGHGDEQEALVFEDIFTT